MACPFRPAIQNCPLYVESHIGSGRGCIQDVDGFPMCRVQAGGMDFETAVLDLAGAGTIHDHTLAGLTPAGAA
ncbi:MAG TPA: hypothetical protein VNQ99_06310 [Xanthobacteraceae bacterium]|nr:hypothetical protein [Xanthobacteraceae bacterium]